MANINLKKKKRALRADATPYKEVVSPLSGGGKTPRFRQNGYQLDFNNATNAKITYNSVDYPQTTLITSFVAEGKTWLFDESKGDTIESETGEIATISIDEDNDFLNANVWNKKSFALEFDSANSEYLGFPEVVIEQATFLVGNIGTNPYLLGNSSQNNNSYAQYSSVGNYIAIKDDSGSQFFLNNIPVLLGGEVIEIRINVTNEATLYIDSVLVDTKQLSSTLTVNQCLKRGSFAPSYVSFSLHNLSINNEQFNLTEGLGNEVEGSSGTVGTINTSHASGNERINYGMWEKNGNVLRFKSANSDYLSTTITSEIPLLSDISFDCEVNFDNTSVFITYLFSIGFNSGNSFSIAVRADGNLITDGTLNGVSLYEIGQPLTKNMTVSFDGVKVYQNGIETIDLTSKGVVPTNLPIGTGVAFGKLIYQGSRYLDGYFKSVSFQGDQFLFREGQGVTTTSENGLSTATINTSHASGTDYINSEIWNVETSKWIYYK